MQREIRWAGQGVETAGALGLPTKAAERRCRFRSEGTDGSPAARCLMLGEMRAWKASRETVWSPRPEAMGARRGSGSGEEEELA